MENFQLYWLLVGSCVEIYQLSAQNHGAAEPSHYGSHILIIAQN